jgi:hypothetical protein
MKTFFTFLILIYLGLNFGYCQTKKLICLPVLKESIQIDSLIDFMLSNPQIVDVSDSLSKSKDDWIELFMNKPEGQTFEFFLDVESRTNMNININVITRDKSALYGYFLYKRYKVFVWTLDHFDNFFAKTSENKSYKFIFKLKNPDSFDVPFPSREGRYTYKKNRGFKSDPIPPIQ